MTTRNLIGRLGIGTIASAYGYAITVILQLVTLPALLHSWGVELYGKWLMLSALPSFLILSDFGFSTAVMIDVAQKCGFGDRSGAQSSYRSIWIFSSSVSLFLIGIGIATLSAASSVNLAFIAADEVRAISIFICYAALVLQTSIIAAGLRSTGHFPEGTFYPDNITLTEGLFVVFVAMYGGGLVTAATALVVWRAAGLVIFWIYFYKKVPWLRPGFEGASKSEIKRLLLPSLSLALMPMGMAASLQGVVSLIGIVLTPGAAAIYSAVRTVSRLAVQVAAPLTRASVPELSRAIGAGSKETIALVFLTNAILGVCLILPVSIGVAIFGNELVALWSSNKLLPPTSLMMIVAAGSLFHAYWWNAATLLTAAGLQRKYVIFYIISALLALLISWPVCILYGTIGVAVVVLFLEFIMFVRVAIVLSKSAIVEKKALSMTVSSVRKRAIQALFSFPSYLRFRPKL